MTIRLFCCENQLNISDNEIATLEIANRDCFRRIINELKSFDLQENIRELSILDKDSSIEPKDITLIVDPYDIDINDKTNLAKIYKAFENYFLKSDDNMFSLNELSAYINLNFNNLIFGYPLDLTIKSQLTLKDYLKFLDVKVNEDCSSLQDKIMQFINANGVIKFTRIIVFVNLKTMLSSEQIDNVILCAIRNRCHLILLENTIDDRNIDGERKLSLDEDLYCMIK
ncbi:MAG: type II-A CRISPR-associated protein Csn2 [Clostridia bacterium]|nr:type II-A CRISPR-associated protein Csn2 [Clostridia bacterium]